MKALKALRKGGGDKEDVGDAKKGRDEGGGGALGGVLSAAAGGVMGLLRKRKEAVVEEVPREEWEDWNLTDFLKEMNFRDAPSAAGGKQGGGGDAVLPGMSAHPDDGDSFEALMAEYQRYEASVDRGEHPGAGEHGQGGHAGEPALRADAGDGRHVEGFGGTSILKQPGHDKQRADLLKSRGGKDPTSRVKIDEGDVDRRAEVREARTAGATTAGDGMSRPGTVRWGINTASSFGEGADSNFGDTGGRGDTRGSTGGRPDTNMSAMSLQSNVSGRLELEPMGDALMFDQPGFYNCSKQNVLSIPMFVYSEVDFGGPCLVLWAHQNRIKWLPEVVGRLTALTELRLHHNQLEELPPEFALMRSLRKLWLNDNLLSHCPEQLGELTTLEMLSLSRNPFKELTAGVGRLIRLKDLMLDSLELTVPPNEIVVRGPRKIVEYMGKIREAQEACEKYRAGSESEETVVADDKQMVVHRLNNDAPTQDDANFWRKRTFGVDAKGNLCYAMATHPEDDKEWIQIGNVRQIKITKAKNQLNFPLMLSIETARISMFLGCDRGSDRDRCAFFFS